MDTATYDELIKRHGKTWVQEIIQQIERYEGLCVQTVGLSLEARWRHIKKSFGAWTEIKPAEKSAHLVH